MTLNRPLLLFLKQEFYRIFFTASYHKMRVELPSLDSGGTLVELTRGCNLQPGLAGFWQEFARWMAKLGTWLGPF